MKLLSPSDNSYNMISSGDNRGPHSRFGPEDPNDSNSRLGMDRPPARYCYNSYNTYYNYVINTYYNTYTVETIFTNFSCTTYKTVVVIIEFFLDKFPAKKFLKSSVSSVVAIIIPTPLFRFESYVIPYDSSS